MNFTDKIPAKIKSLQGVLEYAGFPTYLVGGAVRDFLLGVEPKDFDLATAATPTQIVEVLKGFIPQAKIDYVGASFGVVLVDGIEIATFRGDRYGDSGDDKEVTISYVKTIEEDLSRRDFSFNALALSRHGKIIDPFGGIADLENRIIRFVGNPADRIREDANRIIRLCRFIAKDDFQIDFDTYQAVRENLHLVYKIAPERIRAEILKAMELQNASAFWGTLLTVGALEIILPELVDSWNHTGGKHHLESVWEHSMLAGDAVSPRFPLVKLAAYLHDIGKPQAFKENQDGTFVNHETIGKDVLEKRLKELKFSKNEVAQVSGLCKFHMRQLFDLSSKAQRKLNRDLHEAALSWEDLVRIRIADSSANLGKEALSLGEVKNIVQGCTKKEEAVFSTHSLAVSGKELMDEWCLTPGPTVGKLQKFLLEFSLEEGTNDPDCLLLKSKDFFKED